MASFFRKKFTFLRIVGFLVLILFVLFFIYFHQNDFLSPKSESEIVITYADNISSAHQKLIDEFNLLNQGSIRVEPIDLPFNKFSTNERKELLARSLRSKSKKIDLFAVDLIWSARFSKWSEPLSKYISKNDTTKLVKQALESCIFNDEVVALPIYIDVGLMYYRKDLLKKIPNYKEIERKLIEGITWKEFISLRQYFVLAENQFYIFPADNYEGLVCSYFELLYNNSPELFTEGEFNMTTDGHRKTLNLLFNLVHNYNISPQIISEFNENNCYEYFIKKDAVFLRGWPSSENDYKKLLNKENVDSLIGKASLPYLEGSTPRSVLGGWNIAISKYSENKKAAFKFIEFLLEEKSQSTMHEIGSYLPAIKSLYANKDFLKKYPNLAYTKSLLDRGIHRPLLENYTKLSDIISFYTNKIIKNEISIDEALLKIKDNISTGRIIIR